MGGVPQRPKVILSPVFNEKVFIYCGPSLQVQHLTARVSDRRVASSRQLSSESRPRSSILEREEVVFCRRHLMKTENVFNAIAKGSKSAL